MMGKEWISALTCKSHTVMNLMKKGIRLGGKADAKRRQCAGDTEREAALKRELDQNGIQ